MKRIVILAIVTYCYAVGIQNQQKLLLKRGELQEECDFRVGNEFVQGAAPVTKFSTSGNVFGPQWCIAKCKHGHSIKAAIEFELSNSSAPAIAISSYRLAGEKREFIVNNGNGQMDKHDNAFCMDTNVAALADEVFQSYDDVETIAEALNYYISKPGWGYLVHEFADLPSVVTVWNYVQDPNFCMKYYEKIIDGKFVELHMTAGLVKS